MSQTVKIDGLNDVYDMFDNGQREFLAASLKASRKASSNAAKRIKGGVPSGARPLVKYKAKKLSSGVITAKAGLYNKQGMLKGGDIPDWFKYYWKNYGTLSGRDPSHTFAKAVKGAGTAAAKSRRNNTGQKAENFFESATDGWDEAFLSDIVNFLKEQGYDINQNG